MTDHDRMTKTDLLAILVICLAGWATVVLPFVGHSYAAAACCGCAVILALWVWTR